MNDKVKTDDEFQEQLANEIGAENEDGLIDGIIESSEVNGLPDPTEQTVETTGDQEGDQDTTADDEQNTDTDDKKGDQETTDTHDLIDPFKAQKKDDGKDEDNELYKEPEGLSEDASKRFQDLVKSNKENVTKLKQFEPQMQQLQTHNHQLKTILDSFQAEPQELDQMIRFSRNLKANTPQSLEAAWTMLEQYRELIGGQLGKDLGGDSFQAELARHPDIQQMLNNLEIKEDVARELIQNRKTRDLQNQNNQIQQQQVAQQQQFQQTHDNVKNALTSLESAWSANDAYTDKVFRGGDGQPASIQDLIQMQMQNLTVQANQGKLHYNQIPQLLNNVHMQLMAQYNSRPARTKPRQPASGSNRSMAENKTMKDASLYDVMTQALDSKF